MEYYNSFHSITEFLRQGKGRLLVDKQRLSHAQSNINKKSRLLQLIQLAEEYEVAVEERPSQELQGLLEQTHYRGYILALDRSDELQSKPSSITELLQRRHQLVVLLDGILDVGNLGAIVRSCDMFGVAAILVAHRSAGRSERQMQNQLARSSSGATAWVPIIEANLAQAARQLQEAGYWLYGADMGGKLANQHEFTGPCALILGAEERGLGSQLRETCDELIRIPTTGHLDSLNVSAAAAVLLYEIQRQWQTIET